MVAIHLDHKNWWFNVVRLNPVKIAVGSKANDSITGNAMVWLLKGNNGRIILVDAGFTDTAQYPFFNNYIRPDIVLKEINIKKGKFPTTIASI